MKIFKGLSILCLTALPLHAQDATEIHSPTESPLVDTSSVKDEPMHFELNNPQYSEGRLSTTEGGVIWGNNFRLQAKNVSYWEEESGVQKEVYVTAEGDLILLYANRAFVADRVEFKLSSRSGELYNGRLGLGDWYIGGNLIQLSPGGRVTIHNAWMSTSPTTKRSWEVYANKVELDHNNYVKASSLSFRVSKVPFFFLPKYQGHARNFFNHPMEYNFVWRGKKRRKLGLRYLIYGGEHWKSWARFEYHIGRGPGGGIDFRYDNPKKGRDFKMNNFISRDVSIVDPSERRRYRLKGHFHQIVTQNSHFNFYYDRYSDSDVISDYSYSGFDRKKAGLTQAIWTHHTPTLMQRARVTAKINPFQTVKKELPEYELSPYPWIMGEKRVINSLFKLHPMIINHNFSAGYLAYDFKDKSELTNYHSSRLTYRGDLSFPVSAGKTIITPQCGVYSITYNHSANKTSPALVAPFAKLSMQATAVDTYSPSHTLHPYAEAFIISASRYSIDEHYLFDYRDALSDLSGSRIGLRQIWFKPRGIKASLDLYSYQFFHTSRALKQAKNYQAEGFVFMTNRWKMGSKLRLNKQLSLSQFNLSSDFTYSPNFAFGVEYRERNRSCWKKANPKQYFLESTRSFDELLNSPLSDRRRAILFKTVFKPNPNWIVRFDTRHGWHRENEAAYNQYSLGVGTDIGSDWRLQFSVEKDREEYSFQVRINLSRAPITPPPPRF